MTERVEQQICIQFCINLNFPLRKLFRWFKRLQGWCNECSTNKSVAQMLQRWLRICWKWSTFWKACNERNTWERWTCTGCNLQYWQVTVWELEAYLGIPKTTVSEILMRDLGMKRVVEKFILQHLLPEQKELVLQLLMTWFKPLPINQVSSKRSQPDTNPLYGCDPETKAQSSSGSRHCPMDKVSCIFFNKCLCFS